jgi:hypothetical protein
MLLQTMAAFAVLMAVLLGWIGVQRAYRSFACRYPEAGPYRQEHQGCAGCAKAEACDTADGTR